MEVLSARYRRGYPALGRCLVWFSRGLGVGAAWQPLLDSYVRRLSAAEAVTLVKEVALLLNSGLKNEGEISLVVSALGWSRDWVPGDTPDVLAVFVYLTESLDLIS